MLLFLARRALAAVPVLFGVLTLSFFLVHLIPGDPADLILGEYASLEDKLRLRESLGLHRPLGEQYLSYLYGAVRLDLGVSLITQKSASYEFLSRFPATMELTMASMFLALLWGIPLGVVAAVRRGRWLDRLVMITGVVGMSVPGFVLGPILIWIFAMNLGLFPVSEREGLEHLVLPALSLAFPLGAILMRITRASMLEVVNEDYIRTAFAKGLSLPYVYFKHALRNALVPIITIVGLQFGALLTGTVITETIFDWPGVGTLLFAAIQRRDYPQVQVCILFIAMLYVVVNTLTDMLYGWANPKVRVDS